MSNWQDFLARDKAGASPAEPNGAVIEDDIAPLPDEGAYQAFILQRGASRPAMFLDLRRYDDRAGTLIGTMMSYPQLVAVDYIDGQMIVLNFQFRQFRLEGEGLAELILRLQAGTVLAVQQYSAKIWRDRPAGAPIVRRIVELDPREGT